MSERTHAADGDQQKTNKQNWADKDTTHIKQAQDDIDIIINHTDEEVMIDGVIQTYDYTYMINEIREYVEWGNFYEVGQ
ncbi:hypothetical protein 7908G4G3_34 [Haloquadratum phage sp.]|nr:hypothetical protein 7908G4G3_34 [Haloquadratum phage sp.]